MRKDLLLIEKQIFDWRDSKDPKIRRSGRPELGPYITISRDYCSGRGRIVRKLSSILKYDLYDKEIIDLIAKSTNFSEIILNNLDNLTQNQLDETIYDLINFHHIKNSVYVKHLTNTIYAIAKKGKVIIVGRGANYILPSKYGLRVRITAPLEDRIKRLVELEKIDPKIAKNRITLEDRKRAKFIRDNFNRDVNDQNGYDLTINSASFEILDIIKIIKSAVRNKIKNI